MDYLKTTDKQKYMGLDNKICENPSYFCKIHQVYLSEDDVARKKCLCKPSLDMLSVNKCKSILTISEYESEKCNFKERVENSTYGKQCSAAGTTNKSQFCPFWKNDGTKSGFCSKYNRI